MRALVAAVGSRGDVEPFILVAEALAERGHTVTLALDRGHLARARPELQREPLGDLDEAALHALVAEALAAPTADERVRDAFQRLYLDRRDELRARLDELVDRGFDVAVVNEELTFPPETTLAWRLPTVIVAYTPRMRRELDGTPALRLAAMSGSVIPDPGLHKVWRFTGFWMRPARPSPDAALERFVSEAAPPFLLTMGSMVGFDGAALGAAFAEAARRCGRRAIVQRGWAGLDAPAAPDVRVVDEVDYAWLFPRCGALFLHGGTGSVAYALAAGRPIGVLPLVNDQQLWATGLTQTGNGVGSLDPYAPTTAGFEAQMRRALVEPRVEAMARLIAQGVRAERGLDEACREIERFAAPA